MKITKISIKKFRGFNDVEFELGTYLTVVSGQNGTQKTTILGMLSQPFSNTETDNPMRMEKPLCGGSFKSAFSDKFKFSEEFDKAGEHEWTLFFDDEKIPSYTVESIHRDKKIGTIRFWQKGDKSKGSGYIQLPVIYLSLKRLLPIGEDNKLRANNDFTLSVDEFEFYQKWHNKILILTRAKDKVVSSNYLSSTHKQTLGANTNHYDWRTNSAGQDNISKILLAILSFKRLKDKYKTDYKGGVLAIDEIDTTFYPGSQVKLIEALIQFAAKFDIQIIFTTHSLTLLNETSKFQDDIHRANQVKLMFLTKTDGQIDIKKNIDYEYIKNHLNRSLTGKVQTDKIDVYTEDKEGAIFVKSLLGQKTKYLNFNDITLGCGNLIQLASLKVPSFIFPNSIIFLDGDVKTERKQYNRVKRIKNILLLPTNKSPEQLISSFLDNLPDSHPLWSEIDNTFDHQFCFQDYSDEIIQKCRECAKKWFNIHIKLWGRNASKVLNYWKRENKQLVDDFNDDFVKLHKEFIKKLSI
ncbi:AAA family ATPase [bacterium]|nr:AAA family ATPase [bacterium]